MSSVRTAHRGRAATRSVVARSALFERLSAQPLDGVTLVAARAGSGKTVLLRSWIEHAHLRDGTAWVSVRTNEHDPQRFWLSVVQQLREAAGAHGFVEKVAPAPEFDGGALVERLLSQLGSLDAPVVLVIDDVHELRSPEALSQLEELIARRPARLRVVLASRHDPPLGLHRLRVAGQITEMRDADLRFTLDETRGLVAGSHIAISDEALAVLHARADGWAAGLRLAVLSLQATADPERFVREFSGSDRTVADYLLTEVLERQPEPVRDLLLRTSILERVSGSLADHLLGTNGSERMLLELERQNAFVVAIDPERSWFRYHQLLADLLRLELRRTEPGAIRGLHVKAAQWFVERGEIIDALRHAEAAEDWTFATRLLSEHGFSLVLNGGGAALGPLIAALPTEGTADPELAAFLAYREVMQRSLDAAEGYIRVAERRAADVAPGHRARFGIALAISRLTIARRRGNIAAVLSEVRPLLEPIATDTVSDVMLNDDARAIALLNLGIAEVWAFGVDEAERHLSQGLSLARRIGRPYIEVGCLSYLALLAGQRSRAEQSRRSAEAITVAEAHGFGSDPIAALPFATIGLSAALAGDFAAAETWLDQAERALPPDFEPATALLVAFSRGLQHGGQGDDARALQSFRAAEDLQGRLVSRHVLTVQARELAVQTQLRLGDVEGARATVARFSAEDNEWGEARAAQAAVHLADGDPRAAIDAVAPVLAGRTRVIREFSLIEAFLFDAIARDRLGEHPAVEHDIERALDLAERDLLIVPFVLAPARELLERHPRHRTAHAALLADILQVLSGSAPRARAGEAEVAPSQLSASELRVLRYLPSHLSAQEIGAELFVSASTVKTHMRHVYEKLGVHRRTDAVEHARQLGLLGAPVRHT